MPKYLLLALGVLLLTLFPGCEMLGGSPDTPTASTIPWNKPASWEGAGALGGLGFQGSH